MIVFSGIPAICLDLHLITFKRPAFAAASKACLWQAVHCCLMPLKVYEIVFFCCSKLSPHDIDFVGKAKRTQTY